MDIVLTNQGALVEEVVDTLKKKLEKVQRHRCIKYCNSDGIFSEKKTYSSIRYQDCMGREARIQSIVIISDIVSLNIPLHF